MFPLTGELDSLGMRAADGREVCGLELLFFQNLLHKNHSEAIALSQLEEPIRAELFSSERLEQHGESLAVAQRVTTTPRKGRPLLPRVLDNGRVLLDSYRAIAQAIREERRDHTCGRVAGRQLSHRRRTAARDSRRPAVRLLPRIA